MTNATLDPLILLHVQALIRQDLALARDDDDLARRLARHGYAFQDTRGGRKLVTLPHGVEVMDLPHHPSALRP
jgi:hypothetical protein